MNVSFQRSAERIGQARLASIDLTEITPAEYRADAVVLLLAGGIPVRAIVVEV